MSPAIGTEVGGRRWPYHAAHPDAWGKPWKGVLLAVDDPRAWADTMAFPGPKAPTKAAVREHLARVPAIARVPVLWDFGDESLVYWESAASLRPYAEDLAAWRAERAAALTAGNRPALAAA